MDFEDIMKLTPLEFAQELAGIEKIDAGVVTPQQQVKLDGLYPLVNLAEYPLGTLLRMTDAPDRTPRLMKTEIEDPRERQLILSLKDFFDAKINAGVTPELKLQLNLFEVMYGEYLHFAEEVRADKQLYRRNAMSISGYTLTDRYLGYRNLPVNFGVLFVITNEKNEVLVGKRRNSLATGGGLLSVGFNTSLMTPEREFANLDLNDLIQSMIYSRLGLKKTHDWEIKWFGTYCRSFHSELIVHVKLDKNRMTTEESHAFARAKARKFMNNGHDSWWLQNDAALLNRFGHEHLMAKRPDGLQQLGLEFNIKPGELGPGQQWHPESFLAMCIAQGVPVQ